MPHNVGHAMLTAAGTNNPLAKRQRGSCETWYQTYESPESFREEGLPLDVPMALTFRWAWTQDVLHAASLGWWFSQLRSLSLDVAVFADVDPPVISLVFQRDQGCAFPHLETLMLKNQAIRGLALMPHHAPCLRSLRIEHPCGVPIEVFDVHAPSLEEVSISYLTIRDGYGLQRSLDPARNPRIRRVERFATTVFLGGVV